MRNLVTLCFLLHQKIKLFKGIINGDNANLLMHSLHASCAHSTENKKHFLLVKYNFHRAELLTQCGLLAYYCVKSHAFLCGFSVSSKVTRLKFEPKAKDWI